MKSHILLTFTILIANHSFGMQLPEEENPPGKQLGTLVSAAEAAKRNYVWTAKELTTTCKDMRQDLKNLWQLLPADIDQLIHNFLLFEQYKHEPKLLLSETIGQNLPFMPQVLAMRINVNIEGSFVPTIDPFEKDEYAEQNPDITTTEVRGIPIPLWPITRTKVSPAEAEVKHTALHHATARNYLEIMRVLLQAGANTKSVDAQKRTPLYYAACKGNLDAIKLLRAYNAGYALRNRNLSPLHAAAAVNAVDVVTYFLNELKANPNFADVCNRTALLFAAEKGAIESVNALITAGADVNIARKDGLTPLLIACIMGHDNVVTTLLKQENINLTSNGSRFAFHYAVAYDQSLIVSQLLQDGRFDPNQCFPDGKTPLIYAVEKAHIQTVAALLSDKRVDTTLKFNGKTAYQLAKESPSDYNSHKVLALFEDHKKTDEECIIQ